MQLPRITVVTPTHQRAEFLEETILSVLNQDYPNLEYIIVDGGSTNPELFTIIKKYETKLAWWISEPDSGHGEAIRKGFDRATGEVLAYLCSDDTYLPGALLAVGQAFEENPQAEIIFGHAKLTDQSGKIIRDLRVVRYHPLQILFNGNIHQASVFWKKSLYLRAGGCIGGIHLEYSKHATDHELFYRFVRTGADWKLLPKALSTFRRHPEQTTVREGDMVGALCRKAYRENYPFYTNPFVSPIVRLTMRLRRWILLIAQGDVYFLLNNISK